MPHMCFNGMRVLLVDVREQKIMRERVWQQSNRKGSSWKAGAMSGRKWVRQGKHEMKERGEGSVDKPRGQKEGAFLKFDSRTQQTADSGGGED